MSDKIASIVLRPEETQLYGDALAAARAQEKVVRRQEAELRQGRLLLAAIGRERARIWTGPRQTHDLDLETTYAMGEAGRVTRADPGEESTPNS